MVPGLEVGLVQVPVLVQGPAPDQVVVRAVGPGLAKVKAPKGQKAAQKVPAAALPHPAKTPTLTG